MPDPAHDRLIHRLATQRQLARSALLFERIWPAIWPALGVLGVFAVGALLDLPRSLPPMAHVALLLVTVVAIGMFLYRGLHGLRAPDQRAADRRLERASGLVHRPLSTISDRPAATDAAGLALWQAHLTRATRQIGRLRVGLPRPGLAKHDNRALRAGLIVALVCGVVIAGPDAAPRLVQSVQPDFTLAAPGLSTQVQAWITPPAYTRLPPVFLKPDGGGVVAPAGARLTISVTGTTETPSVNFRGATAALRALDATSFQTELDLTLGGPIALRGGARDLAVWNIVVTPDQPPIASWPEAPGKTQRGLQLRLPWQVADDYGVVALQADIHLRDRPTAPPLSLKLPLTGGTPAAARGASVQDLSAHPWAGLPVTAILTARDAIDQTGTSDRVTFTLPEREFEHPIARALIAVRKQLSLTPEDRVGALNGLRPLMLDPSAFAADFGGWLNLSATISALARHKTPQSIDDVQSRLWELAIHLEEGGPERTARALEQARKEAREALERAEQSPEDRERRAELERKLAELNEAIKRHLDALANQARREMSEIPPELERLNPAEMDRLAREAEQAAREGKMDTARERMAELERMLDEMRNAQGGREQNQQRNAERRQRGRQQMSAVQDLIGREGQLLDNSQRRATPTLDGRPPRGQSQTQLLPPQPPPDFTRQGDQTVQQALRRSLGELMQQFGDLSGKIPPALNEAEQSMRDAAEALSQGRDAVANRAEQRAIEALQRGGREMGQQMARQFGPARAGEAGEEGDGDGDPFGFGFSLQDGQSDRDGGGQGTEPSRRRGSDRRDPLGRQLGQGTSGADESADVRVPEEMERQRTQNLQQELRRRGGERFRSQEELDYIDRLLRRFQ